jgi:fumarate reductase subunit D
VIDVIGRRREDVFWLLQQWIGHFDALIQKMRLALTICLLPIGEISLKRTKNRLLFDYFIVWYILTLTMF